MSTTIYAISTTFGETVHFAADLTQASAPISDVDDETLEIGSSTQYQTADARHDLQTAAELYISTLGREWFAAPDDDRDDHEIIADVISSVDCVD